MVSLCGTELSALIFVAPASRRLSGGRRARLARAKARANKETANEKLENIRHLANAIGIVGVIACQPQLTSELPMLPALCTIMSKPPISSPSRSRLVFAKLKIGTFRSQKLVCNEVRLKMLTN